MYSFYRVSFTLPLTFSLLLLLELPMSLFLLKKLLFATRNSFRSFTVVSDLCLSILKGIFWICFTLFRRSQSLKIKTLAPPCVTWRVLCQSKRERTWMRKLQSSCRAFCCHFSFASPRSMMTRVLNGTADQNELRVSHVAHCWANWITTAAQPMYSKLK